MTKKKDYNGFVEVSEPINTVQSLTIYAKSLGYEHILLIDTESNKNLEATATKLWNSREVRALKPWCILRPTVEWTILFCFRDEQDAIFAKLLIS